MKNQKNYQFISLPTKLALSLDNNCLKVLVALMTYKPLPDGSILTKGSLLSERCNLSTKVVYNALKGLEEKGILKIELSKKKFDQEQRAFKSLPTKIFINVQKFIEYDKYTIEEIIYSNELSITIKKYFSTVDKGKVKGDNREIASIEEKNVFVEELLIEEMEFMDEDLTSNLSVEFEDELIEREGFYNERCTDIDLKTSLYQKSLGISGISLEDLSVEELKEEIIFRIKNRINRSYPMKIYERKKSVCLN